MKDGLDICQPADNKLQLTGAAAATAEGAATIPMAGWLPARLRVNILQARPLRGDTTRGIWRRFG